ncbi:MAG TPA: HIT family protein [Planctomycetota bacterium]|nr:HIT family protein [Planctomycetota bacterium]
MNSCIICRIIKKELPAHIIYSNDRFVAFLDINPINPGHLIVSPLTHVDYVFDLDDATYSDLFRIARRLSRPLKTATNARRIALAIEGFGIPHVHVHLVPVNSGNELNPERQAPAHMQELERMATMICSALDADGKR